MARTNGITYKDWTGEDAKIYKNFCNYTSHLIGRKKSNELRLRKFRSNITSVVKTTGKPCYESLVSVKTLKDAILKIQSARNYSPESKKDFIKFIARLYLFCKTGDGSLKYAPKEVKELVEYSPAANERRAAKAVITREEARDLIKRANILDSALILTLFESGCRISEFTNIQKEDVKITNEGIELFIRKGKTGQRRIFFVEATKYLAAWLDRHPARNKNAPLWTSERSSKPLTDGAIDKRIRLAVGKLNKYSKENHIPLFSKPFNCHNFRHSRASELGGEPGMTEAIMCKYFGWELGSDMPRTYIHLSDEQVKKAVLKTYGKAVVEDKKIETHRTCQRCKEENPIGLNFCGRCGSDLNSGKVVKSMAEMQDKLDKMELDMANVKKTLMKAMENDLKLGKN